jgi:hypothetical protein
VSQLRVLYIRCIIITTVASVHDYYTIAIKLSRVQTPISISILPYVRNHCLALHRILVSKLLLIPRMMGDTAGNQVGHRKDNKRDCSYATIRRDSKPHPLHHFTPIMRSRHSKGIEATADWNLIPSILLTQSRQVNIDLPIDASAVTKEHDAH